MTVGMNTVAMSVPVKRKGQSRDVHVKEGEDFF